MFQPPIWLLIAEGGAVVCRDVFVLVCEIVWGLVCYSIWASSIVVFSEFA